MKITDELIARGWKRTTYLDWDHCGLPGIGRAATGYCMASARWIRYPTDRPVCARHALQAPPLPSTA